MNGEDEIKKDIETLRSIKRWRDSTDEYLRSLCEAYYQYVKAQTVEALLA